MNEVDKERLHSVLGFDNYDDFYKKLLDVIETAALRICDVKAKSSFEGNLADNTYTSFT